jgi:hypothetical protein
VSHAERSQRIDEQSLARRRSRAERKAHGAWFTPAQVVDLVLDEAAQLIPRGDQVTVVDPACGAGAFLHAAHERLPLARLVGLELDEGSAALCRARVPSAKVGTGDALRGGLWPLLAHVPAGAFELWVGNPPYNGTSPLLRDPVAYRALLAELAQDLSQPKGTSLRDDFAFFLLLALRRLEGRAGAVAFVTSASWLDAFLYAPLRQRLLERLQLRAAIELGAGVFEGTRVKTCVTVWSTRLGRRPARYRARSQPGPFERSQLGEAVPLQPCAPEFRLRPEPARATELDARWRAQGEPLSIAIPVSFPGLKTRFDELLVDSDEDRLWGRIHAFATFAPQHWESFARAHRLPERTWPKLRALKAALPADFFADPACLRPFYRYAGARHRGHIPESARAFCFLDRRLIPRGDHRLRGGYDPHGCPTKLVFNTRELPLASALLERPGCVHDHRHARFAPLLVPAPLLEHGLAAARRLRGDEPLVPNLSARALCCAERLGGPAALFRILVAFINGAAGQEEWAPTFGTSRELPVPYDTLLKLGAAS